MNRRLMTMLATAFLVAVIGSYIVYRLVGAQMKANSGKGTATIIVAARDLEVGTLLKAEDLRAAELVGEPPKGVLLKIENAVGRGLVSPIYSGEPVSEKRLARVGSGAGLAATIPPGMRACAVRVDDVVGVAGFAIPGSHVDVLISGNGGNNSGARVKTLLQNIEVLSAGKNFQPDQEGKPVEVPVVNLLVNPQQAELLSLAASNQTHIQLVLRNPMDRETVSTTGSELTALFGVPEAPKAPPAPPVVVVRRPAAVAAPPPVEKPAPPAVRVIQVSNGAKRSEQKFESKGLPQ